MNLPSLAMPTLTLLGLVWVVWAWRTSRVPTAQALMLAAGACAALASGMGWVVYPGIKPVPLAIAAWLAWQARPPQRLLALAFAASWGGDVALLAPEGFLVGLVCFLLAHLGYIRVFSRGVRWGGHRVATLGLALYGVGMATYLFSHGLPGGLYLPVTVYAVALCAMAAQAVGRWAQLRTRASAWVAAGAILFVLSDTVLAVQAFVQPLHPLGLPGSYWLLNAYFTGQWLILRGMLHRDVTA